jgi:hypothetical protein
VIVPLNYQVTKQRFKPGASVSDPDPNPDPDPHSMGSSIRIRIANADPDPEGGKSAPKKEKIKS